MANYKGYPCPVCGKKFRENEDIVTCPKCGTPAHRSCYNKLGGCINSAKHGDGFEYMLPEAPPNEAEESAENLVQVKSPASEIKAQPLVHRESQGKTPNDTSAGAVQTSEYYTAIGRNADKYISRFESMKRRDSKLSFNFSAAVFGPYWYFYRKINKTGMFFIGIELIINALLTVVFRPTLIAFYDFFNGYYELAAKSGITADAITEFYDKNFKAEFMVPFAVMVAVILVSRIIGAVVANHFYLNRLNVLIVKAKQQLDDPGFIQMVKERGIFTGSAANVLKMYLTQLGGTSVFTAFMGYFGYRLLSSLIGTFL